MMMPICLRFTTIQLSYKSITMSDKFEQLLGGLLSSDLGTRNYCSAQLEAMDKYTLAWGLLNTLTPQAQIPLKLLALTFLKSRIETEKGNGEGYREWFANQLLTVYNQTEVPELQGLTLQVFVRLSGLGGLRRLLEKVPVGVSPQPSAIYGRKILFLHMKILQFMDTLTTAFKNSGPAKDICSHVFAYINSVQLQKQPLGEEIQQMLASVTKILASRRMLLPFDKQIQLLRHANPANDSVVRDLCYSLQKCLVEVKPSYCQARELHQLLLSSARSTRHYSEETLTGWLGLFNVVLKYILTGQGGQENLRYFSDEDGLNTTFVLLMNVFKESSDQGFEVRNRSQQTLSLLKNFIDQDILSRFLSQQRRLLQQKSGSQGYQQLKSIYLYLVGGLIDSVDEIQLFHQVLSDLGKPISTRLLLSCLEFLQILVSARRIDSNMMPQLHLQLLQVLKTRQSLLIKRSVYGVMAAYMHVSQPRTAIQQICEEFFRFITAAQSQDQAVLLFQILTGVGQQPHTKADIHNQVLKYIQSNLPYFIKVPDNNIHYVSKVLSLLALTVTKNINIHNQIYLQLIQTYLGGTYDCLIDSSLALFYQCLLADPQWASWKGVNIFLQFCNSKHLMDRMQLIIPILIEMSIRLGKEVEQVCGKLLSSQSDTNNTYTLLPLINILSIVRGVHLDPTLITCLLRLLKTTECKELTATAIRVLVRKDDGDLARNTHPFVDLEQVWGNLHNSGLRPPTMERYLRLCEAKSLEQIFERMSLEPESQGISQAQLKMSIYSRPFFDYQYQNHSPQVLSTLADDPT